MPMLSQVVRGAVLLTSSTLAALLVTQAGIPGCDRPTETPPPTPRADAPKAPEPTKAEAKAELKAEPKAEPIQPEAKAPHYFPASKAGVFIEATPPLEAKAEAKAETPRYFPASKAGVFIEPAPKAQPQAQQAGPP